MIIKLVINLLIVVLYYLNLFGKKLDDSIKNHQIFLINYWIIHISRYFAYHILYHIRVLNSESDILIHQIAINRIWILKKRFGNRFGMEIILSVYIPTQITLVAYYSDR
jgi:hypothetical protein